MIQIHNPWVAFLLVMLIFTIGQSVFAAFTLMTLPRGDRMANRWLAGLLLVLAYVLTVIFVLDVKLVDYPHLMQLEKPALFLLPALLWFYVREITSGANQTLHKRDLIHFAPALLALLVLLPFYMMSGMDKLEWRFMSQADYIRLTDEQNYASQVVRAR